MNETQKDTYDAWAERMAAGREGKPLTTGEMIESGKPQPYAAIEFLRLERPLYVGEVGKRGEDYIFHFFPKAPYDLMFKESLRPCHPQAVLFEEKMGDVFLSVFKNPKQIQAVWTEEMRSWAVKVSGFVNTVWGDDQAVSIFAKLDAALGQ